jgi:uncharacterized protein with HEPN domain
MKDTTRKWLFDVVDSGRNIQAWCQTRSFADYEADRQFRRAVEREFEIIGEALNRLDDDDLGTARAHSRIATHCGIPQPHHYGYDTVDDAPVWGVISEHLPRLIQIAEMLLKESGEPV